MTIEVPLDDLDIDKVGGFDKIAPGSYHYIISAVNEDGGQKGEMIVDFELLRGTTQNQEGKSHREFFSKELNKEMPRRKMFALAIACGLTTKDEMSKLKAEGKSPSLDFASIVGRQGCFNLEANEWNGKTSTRLAWDEIYAVTDKRASHVPLNMTFIKKAGIELPPNRNPDGAVSSMPQKQQKPAAPAASPQQAASVDDLLGGVNF